MRPAASDSDRAAAAGKLSSGDRFRGGSMLRAPERPRNRICRIVALFLAAGCVGAAVMLWRAVHAVFPGWEP